MKNPQDLCDEAMVLAERINAARYSEVIPSAEMTVRLCELLAMLLPVKIGDEDAE